MADPTEQTPSVEQNPEVEKHDQGVLDALDGNQAPVPAEETKPAPAPATPTDPADRPRDEHGRFISVEEASKLKEELKADLKPELVKETKDEIAQMLVGKPQAEKDAFAKFEQTIWDKEGRPPTWQEGFEFLSEMTAAKIKADQAAEAKQAEETRAQEIQTKTENQKKWDTYWDHQLDDLTRAGKIPPVQDPNDPNDPGRKARLDLFQKMYDVSSEIEAKGGIAVTNLKEIYYEHYQAPQKPEGAYAPVHGANRSVTTSDSETINMNEVRQKSIHELISEAASKLIPGR